MALQKQNPGALIENLYVRVLSRNPTNNGDFIKANSETIFSTGNAIISTSLILGCGFVVMVSSNFLPSRDFGFLSAITMFGAIIGDLFFLPTMLRLIKPKTGN